MTYVVYAVESKAKQIDEQLRSKTVLELLRTQHFYMFPSSIYQRKYF